MVADGYHSLLDSSSSLLGLVVTSFSYAPPDSGHPYGHRKFETSATLVVGGALLLFSYRLIESAFGAVSHSVLPEIGPLNWTVMGLTILVNLAVSSYTIREGRRLGSEYLLAQAADTHSDIYVSLGVIVSFAGARARLAWVDALVAAVIALFVAYLAVRVLVAAFHVLTDRAVIPPERLAPVVLSVPQVVACREIRTRGRPDAVYVDLVVHVDGDLTLRAAHEVADAIEAALATAHPEIVDVVVHLEPSG
jgi:cation diffusion facilitator family transporter